MGRRDQGHHPLIVIVAVAAMLWVAVAAYSSGTAGISPRLVRVTKALTASTTTAISLSGLDQGNLNHNDTLSMVFKVTGTGTVDIDIWPEISLDSVGEGDSTKLGYAKARDTPVYHWAVLNTTGSTALYIPLPQSVRLAVRENVGNAGLTFTAKVAAQ